MPFEFGVQRGVVAAEMCAPALLARERAARDEERDVAHIAGFVRVGIQILQLIAGFGESFG